MREIKKYAVSIFVLLSILLTASVVRANETEIVLRTELAGVADEDNESMVYFVGVPEAPERKDGAVETLLDVVFWDLTKDLSR